MPFGMNPTQIDTSLAAASRSNRQCPIVMPAPDTAGGPIGGTGRPTNLQLALVEPAPDPGVDHGEVFTRRWVVELILDLVGYSTDCDLAAKVIVEPSCGSGAFLIPIVERLVTSSLLRGHDPRSLSQAIRAFDLLEANAKLARKAVAQLLQ
ncbi:MAG: N-6 DNA methylase, partial [Actinomycetota bacterium]